jgi:mannose-1-phosphate guanylyltransferase/phosphomannomutase
MRVMVEESKNQETEMLDGVKIFDSRGWVLILPDPVDPVVHLFADATSAMQADQLLETYVARIRALADAPIPGPLATRS